MSFLHANFAARVDRAGGLQYGSASSCAVDLQRVHELRETYPAIVVGRNTFELDQPSLTAREEHLGRPPMSQPRRFVLTRDHDFQPPIGYQKIICPSGDLTVAVQQLVLQGFQGILLEAGPTLLNVAIQQGIINALTIYLRGADVAEPFRSLSQAFPHLPHSFKIERLGDGHLLTFDMLASAGILRQTNGFVCTPLLTEFGRPLQITFRDPAFGREHGALVYGDPSLAGGSGPPLVRVHSECWTSSYMTSLRCECQQQLLESHRKIAAEGRGVLIIHNAEGRGIGRLHKTAAYEYQELEGLDTLAANRSLGLPEDAREYFSIAWILRRLGITKIRLLTNNPAKSEALRQGSVEVVEQIPLAGFCTPENARYLGTKVRHGHDPRILPTP